MKVRELIEKLEKYDPEQEVYGNAKDEFYSIDGVHIYNSFSADFVGLVIYLQGDIEPEEEG